MQDLIDNGTIVAEGSYNIVTDGDYTALVTPDPVNPGSEGLVALAVAHVALRERGGDGSALRSLGTVTPADAAARAVPSRQPSSVSAAKTR